MNIRKFVASISALAIAVTSTVTFGTAGAIAATTFTDASNIASWATDSVAKLAEAGVLSGRPNGSFDPKGTLNRAELAKVAVKGAKLTEDTTGAPHFNDVKPTDWYYSFVETLYNNGVVGGVNGGALDAKGLATFNPAGTVNRAEAAKILVEALDLETSYAGTPPNFTDVAKSAWFFDYVETAYAHGILNGYGAGKFGPSDPVTREQVSVIAQAGREEAGKVDGVAAGSKKRTGYKAGAASTVAVDPTPTPTPTPTASDGTLAVALAATTPADQTFPKGAASTAVAAYDFTASSAGDVTVTNLSVKRTGVGTDGDWTLYIYDGANRLTSGKTVNSTSHEATFTGLNVTIAKGTTKTLTLKADTSSSSTGGISYFEITKAESVSSNGKGVTGTFPVVSKKNEINTSVTAGSVTVETNGSLTNPKVGEKGIAIAKFKITANNEDAKVEQVALLVNGTISTSAVQNAKLYQGTTEIATATAVNSKDLLVFSFATPYTIAKGDSRTFEVKADLNTGRSSDTIKVYVDEGTDVVAKGGTYGFGMTVTRTSYDNSANDGTDASWTTVQGGDITISSNGPSAADIAVNGKDIKLMEFNITTKGDATFKKFEISLTPGTAAETASASAGLIKDSDDTANFTDIKITNKKTGAVVMGPVDVTSFKTASGGSTAIADATDAAISYYLFQDEFSLKAGESLDLVLTADVANNSALANETLYAKLEVGSTYPEIRDVNNKTVTNSSSVVPSSAITGKTMTVKTAGLTVTKSSTPTSKTFVKGAKQTELLGLTAAAGTSSDIKLSQVKIRLYGDDDGTFDNSEGDTSANDLVSNVTLYVGSTAIAGPKGMTLTGTIASDGGYYYATFDNMNYTIKAGETKQIVVKADISNNISATRYIAADIDPDNDITAEDKDGNSVTASGTSSLNNATGPSPVITASTGGSLTVAVDSATAKENIVVAGSSDVAISKFKFTTTDEAFVVKKLSINNRQSAVTSTTTLGDYDNNVTSIKITYKNSAGTEESKTGYLTSGTANFSGLDLYVAADNDAVLTVTATLNTITSGATAAEFVDLNLAFNDFEAVANGSGETYKADKLDATVAASSDLDIGTITWTDSSYDTNAVAGQTVSAAGSSQTFIIDTGTVVFPVGTLLFVDAAANGTYDEGADSLFVTTATWSTTTPTVTVLNDADASLADNLNVYYALPGTGYLTASNQMKVYKTKPTVALASTSPSGSRTVASSDSIFVFTVAADAGEKVAFRGAEINDATTNTADFNASALAGTFTATDALSTVATGGIGNSAFQRETSSGVNAASIIYTFGTAANLSGYSGISFWVQSSDNANTITLTMDDDAGSDQTVASGTITASTWQFVDLSFAGMTSTDIDAISTLTWAVTDGSAVNAATYDVDRIAIYKDKVTVDLAADADIDTNTSSSADNLVAYLKEGGSTVATGYVYSSTQGADASSASITFYPQAGTDSDIEISKGTTKTFTVELNSGSLLAEDAGSDDPLTASIDLGSSSAGTVTAGDVWWYDNNGTVTSTIKWVGDVSSSTLNGNTLKY